MFKLLLSLVFFLAISCNSGPDTTEATKNADTTTATTTYTWNSEDEKEYLAHCVAAAGNLSDTAAYARCKCVLDQLKQVYPSMDSAYAKLDSAAVLKYAANCQ